MSLDFRIIWHEDALKDLKKIERSIAKNIIDKAKNYLIKDPSKLGSPLRGSLKGFFRYRIGKYRVIYVIDHGDKKIIVLKISHRKKGYK